MLNVSANTTVALGASFMEDAEKQWPILCCFVAAFVVCLFGQMFVFNQVSTSQYKNTKPLKQDKDVTFLETLGDTIPSPEESPIIVRKRNERKREVTWAEVQEHNTKDDLWIVCDGKAFNITSFLPKHPGGYRPLVAMASRDCTDVMHEFHPSAVFEKYLPNYYVGDVVDDDVPALLKDYRKLRQDLLARGLFKTSRVYYWAKYVWLLSIFAPAMFLVICCSSTVAHYTSAVLLALFWQQLAFVGHDLGHNSVTHDRKFDYFWGGLIGNFLGGIGLSWWKNSHNVHHVTCNSIEHDPDIQHLPFLAVTGKIFGKYWSTYHEKFFVTGAIERFLVSYQHILFYPIMALARFNLYVQSWIMLVLRNEVIPYKKLEMVSLAGFWVWMYLFISFLPANERLTYLLLSHAAAGVLHIQITISHFAMDTFHGTSQDDWVRHQLKTSMNVSCATWLDWFHGGLQFQIEHHLFPRLPRHNLRIARLKLLELAQKHDLPYLEEDFVAANIRVVKKLKETADEAKKLTKGDGGFYESQLYQALNAQG